jgi:hypothetical protein
MPFPAWIPVLGPALAQRRMRRDLPLLATFWGLTFVESDQRRFWGRFEGSMEGYSVRIEPDASLLAVTLGREVEDFCLSTLDVGRKPRDFGLDPRLGEVFRCIDFAPRQAQILRGRPDVIHRVLSLWGGRVSGIAMGPGGLTCVLHYPFADRNGPHYVETADVERILPEMVGVVRLFEPLLAR